MGPPALPGPIAIQAALLRDLFAEPDLLLRPGSTVVARVAARAEGQPHGTLVLAGVPLTAQLPDEVAAGQTLRLTVAEVTAERVLMRLEPPPATATAPHAQPAAALEQRPAQLAVSEPPRRGGPEGETVSVALAFESARLGRLDLRIELAPGGVRATVAAPAGPSYEVAREHAGGLRAALEARLERAASVSVSARRPPLDVYA